MVVAIVLSIIVIAGRVGTELEMLVLTEVLPACECMSLCVCVCLCACVCVYVCVHVLQIPDRLEA